MNFISAIYMTSVVAKAHYEGRACALISDRKTSI